MAKTEYKSKTKEQNIKSVKVHQPILKRKTSKRYPLSLKKALTELKKSESELEQIFNTAANAMWVIDKNFNVIRINETFWNLNVLFCRQIKNKKCYEIFKSSLCNTKRCPLKKILQGEKSVECELKKEKLDRTKATFLVKAVPFKSTDGLIVGIVEDFRDITRLKLAEERTRKIFEVSLVPFLMKVLKTPFTIMTPIIAIFCLITGYVQNFGMVEVWEVLAFGVLGYFCKKTDYPVAPFILALVLGPMTEYALRQSLLQSDGSLMIFIAHPISLTLLIISIFLYAFPIAKNIIENRRLERESQ